MEDIKISLIIPIKNRADLLPITLRNILAQTLQPHQIIVVDDGSDDDLESVARQFAPTVQFIKSEGRGPGAARNTGLRAATGNAIQFFDSDDLMTLNKLEVQAKLLAKNNADFVYGPLVKAKFEEEQWCQTEVILQYYALPARPLADMVLEGWCAITQSALFKKSLIDKVGFWREDLMPYEDYEYWFRIGKLARHFVHEKESCVIYRQHSNQITGAGVAPQSKWLDGLKAMAFIRDKIDYPASFRSRLIFKGRHAMSKLQYRTFFPGEPKKTISLIDYATIPVYKFINKLGRLQTKSDWQKINGVLNNGEAQFVQYLAKLQPA